MTCTHVLGLIDAGPFADYPPAHLDAAWRHARGCATCGPALEAGARLTGDLAGLPQPAPPPDLAVGVMARIARIEQPPGAAAAAAMPDTRTPSIIRDWPAWAIALGSFAAGLAIILPGDNLAIDLASRRVGGITTGLIPMPPASTWALVLAAALLLYVAGLFASSGRRRHAAHRSPYT